VCPIPDILVRGRFGSLFTSVCLPTETPSRARGLGLCEQPCTNTAVQFDSVAASLEGIPFTTREQGRVLYDHVRATGARDVLELGTGHGVSACYIAAALHENGAGHVTTVDSCHTSFADPTVEELVARVGLTDFITVDRRFSTYTWFLKAELERQAAYDFCFIDGQKNWTTDGLAVLLVARLLREDGWLLLDDLDWRYADKVGQEASDWVSLAALTQEERETPHVRAIFELIVMRDPSFGEFRIQDDWWAWAKKTAAPQRTLRIEVTRSWRSYVVAAARLLSRDRARRASAS
jgi:predicted O-methyltransferase YrrM